MEVLKALWALINWRREQTNREAQFAAQVETDWRESFTGTIDEFKARDAA